MGTVEDNCLKASGIKMRDSNLELYRIIAMFLILCGHYVFNSGLLTEMWGNLSANSLFYYAFGIWGKTGINCFVMITGYFMCTSQISLRKFLKLLLQIEFYNIIIAVIFLSIGYKGYNWGNFLLDIMPFRSISTGFISCFIFFYLLIPFLNVMVKALSRMMHIKLILLLLTIYCFMLYLPHSVVTFNYVSWFVVLYFVSSYIRFYPESIYKSDNSKVWGWLSLAAIFMSFFSVVSIMLLNRYCNTEIHSFLFVLDSNALLAFLTGATTFMFFKNLRIKNYKIINAIAATTFGVLLIHSNSEAMREWLWVDVVDCVGHYHAPYHALYYVIVCITIFSICSFIDWIRIKTVEKWLFDYLDKKYFKQK